MTARAIIVHRDHSVIFFEEDETWRCSSLALTDKSLVKLKRAIDREWKTMRKMRVPAIVLHQHITDPERAAKPVTITLLHGDGRRATVEYEASEERLPSNEHLDHLFDPAVLKAWKVFCVKDALADKAIEARDAAWEKVEAFNLTPERIREIVAQQADEER